MSMHSYYDINLSALFVMDRLYVQIYGVFVQIYLHLDLVNKEVTALQ